MPAHKHKVDRAITIARDALKNSESALMSFSGGKDSIVMLDIALKAGFCGELLFFNYGICTDKETPQETRDIIQHYSKLHGLKCNIVDCLGEFDCWDELGYFCLFPESEQEKKVFKETNKDFAKKAKDFQAKHGCDLLFIGMRKDESKARKIMLCKKGHTYTTKNRDCVTCCPVSNFTDDDIWAYIYANNLKYPSFYDCPHLDRGKIRNEPCLLYNDAIVRHGGAYEFKILFPEYMAEIKKRYPEAIL